MTGVLVDINKINYTGKDGKAGTLCLAVLEIEDFEESIIISEAKAKEIEGCLEQTFKITIKRTTMYTKDGVARNAIAFSLGSNQSNKTKGK